MRSLFVSCALSVPLVLLACASNDKANPSLSGSGGSAATGGASATGGATTTGGTTATGGTTGTAGTSGDASTDASDGAASDASDATPGDGRAPDGAAGGSTGAGGSTATGGATGTGGGTGLPTCNTTYGSVAGYVLCTETATDCIFFTDTGSNATDTCDNICVQTLGKTCSEDVANQNSTTCTPTGTTSTTCLDARKHQICTCSR